MADTEEAPSKRKTDSAEETVEFKKPRVCVPEGDSANKVHIDVNLAQHQSAETEASSSLAEHNNETCLTNGKLQFSGRPEEFTHVTGEPGGFLESIPNVGYAAAESSASVALEDTEALGEGEVLEDSEKEDEEVEAVDEDEELSEIDTEDDSAEEGADSDDHDSEDTSDEEDEEPTSTSSDKGKGIEKGKGKEKVVDVKGKGIMSGDKGKGKAKMEDEDPQASDEDDTGSLSEDPLDEVDLNNILPTRTRRRSSSTHYDLVDEGNDEEEEDDDSDA